MHNLYLEHFYIELKELNMEIKKRISDFDVKVERQKCSLHYAFILFTL
jgi:hypothetical protein